MIFKKHISVQTVNYSLWFVVILAVFVAGTLFKDDRRTAVFLLCMAILILLVDAVFAILRRLVLRKTFQFTAVNYWLAVSAVIAIFAARVIFFISRHTALVFLSVTLPLLAGLYVFHAIFQRKEHRGRNTALLMISLFAIIYLLVLLVP